MGDPISIRGDYQFNAVTRGPAPQRFWHQHKVTVLSRLGIVRPASSVLDIGCGSGVVTDYLAEQAAEVIGVDANPLAVQFAEAHWKRPNLKFVLCELENLDVADASFDIVIALEIFEHLSLPNANLLFQKAYKALRPGGSFVITTPNYRSPWPLLEWCLDRTRLVPPMAEVQHVLKPTFSFVKKIAEDNSFAVVSLRRDFGAAFLFAALNWNLASGIDHLEYFMGCPLGSLLVGHFERPR